jgi:hypothetical protein
VGKIAAVVPLLEKLGLECIEVTLGYARRRNRRRRHREQILGI